MVTGEAFPGEQFVFGRGGAAIAVGRLHRYQLVVTLTRGHVLDLGCGAGLGARLLCRARQVVALDISLSATVDIVGEGAGSARCLLGDYIDD